MDRRIWKERATGTAFVEDAEQNPFEGDEFNTQQA